ncbi:hypothetical protein D6C87_09194 [Aureobasidium pullulans]|uniref:Uncharacterized protein n=1 Tax=Aureobasidium pullulans TaxID=5580 RepID=A0AB38LJZ4_AURPU|nr:hypothetical protein D6C94_10577 [Aureobasidium pullulans]THZ36396.1 hypothetical protein D6C87_09194 [Aureobasidium pullulans]
MSQDSSPVPEDVLADQEELDPVSRLRIFRMISAFSFTDLRFPGIWKAKQEFASTSIERCPVSPTANEDDTVPSASDEQSAEKRTIKVKSSRTCYSRTDHGYSRPRQPIHCAERSPHRAEQQSLGHTPMEQKIDKRMAAYSNKFSTPGIISDLTDVDTDVLTQCICSELRVVNYYKDRQHIDIKSARNLESVESFIDDME